MEEVKIIGYTSDECEIIPQSKSVVIQTIEKNIIGSDLRNYVFNRDGNACLKCETKENLTLDHILPKSKMGSNHQNNLQTMCKTCNNQKADTYADYRKTTK
jgi:5-methylcytosine-specific restriction endonuclease McrA